jgi:hypothetical protein
MLVGRTTAARRDAAQPRLDETTVAVREVVRAGSEASGQRTAGDSRFDDSFNALLGRPP